MLIEVMNLFEKDESEYTTPAILRRCVVAVFKSRKKGSAHERLATAFKICTKTMQRNGYLKPGTHEVTAKGKKRSAKKAADDTHAEKMKEYDRILKVAKVTRKKEKEIKKSAIAATAGKKTIPRAAAGGSPHPKAEGVGE